MSENEPPRRYRFGAFEADVATGELRRQGMRIKLNAQPFQMLALLLNRPGELLTRDEIARELWPDGTSVDYEHGVNSAVNRIREALGDTATNPRFIETLARRGYRFIAPVEQIAVIDEAARPSINPPPSPPDEAEPAPGPAPEEPALRGTRILATPEELPKASSGVVQTLFVLMQFMYLGFYVGSLANLREIEDLLSPLPKAFLLLDFIMVTAAILMPVRAFVICAVFFRPPGFGKKFLKIWPFLMPFDELWSLSPFLLLHHIDFGLALACTALLVYVPFAQRSLVLMGAGAKDRGASVSSL